MPVVRVLTRGWKIEVNGIPIKGMQEMTLNRTKSNADTTTQDDAGFETHLVARRGGSISFKGLYLEDEVTGERDPGQEACEVLGRKIGADSIGAFKLTTPGGKEYTLYGSVEISDTGGAEDDASSWGMKIDLTGPIGAPV